MSTLPAIDETTLPAFVTAIRRALNQDDAIRRARTFLGLDNTAYGLSIDSFTGNPCNIGKRIDALLRETGFNLIEIEEREGISSKTIRGIINGNHVPALTTLIALAKGFGVSLDYLACLSDERSVTTRNYTNFFSEQLRTLMHREGFTIQALSRRTKISVPAITVYKNGSSYPGYWYFIELAKALDVSLDYLSGITKVEKQFPQKR